MIGGGRRAEGDSRARSRLTRRGRTLLGLVTAVAVGVAAGALLVPREVPADDGGVLDEAAARLSSDAVRPMPRKQLEEAALDAMLAELGDPWSSWSPARAAGLQENQVETDGTDASELGGPDGTVGLRLSAAPTGEPAPVVAGVVPGSGAARAGVALGAVVESVDGEPAGGVPTTLARLRGEPGTRVVVRLRTARGPSRVVLVREVRAPVEALHLEPDVVQVRVSAFPAGAGRAVRSVVEQAGDDGASGLVLDLRGNGGGLLHEAVETASAFLESGPVLTYQRRGEAPRTLEVVAAGDATTPLVVLVDGGTASAAEVVAAALADRRGAVLVGSRTVGKGSVQEPVVLADGTALRVTVARYLPPSGQVVEGVGLEPDVAVAPDAAPGVAEARAAEVLLGLVADAGSLPVGAPGTAVGAAAGEG